MKSLLKSILKFSVTKHIEQLATPNLCSWFYRCMQTQVFSWGYRERPLNYYEFGVAGGGSLKEFIRASDYFHHYYRLDVSQVGIYLFDSFSGLPPKKSARDDHPSWHAGGMSHPKEEARAVLRQFDFPAKRVRLTEGYFEKSLTPTLRAELQNQPPSIVTIDCDYYSSTRSVLDFLEPFVPSGTFFYFDDIWSFHGHPELGQIKAISEINQRGEIFLTPYTANGLPGHSYLCARKNWEYAKGKK